MSGLSNWPSYSQFLSEAWGWGTEFAGPGFTCATNVVVGANPPYTVADFLGAFPSFGGNALVLNGTITQGSPVIPDLQTTAGILPGQAVSPTTPMGNGAFIAGYFPAGTSVVSVDSDVQATLSNGALGNGGQVAIFSAPYIATAALIAYVNLASSCLVYNRWLSQWSFAMGLFIAHYATLYLRATANPVSSAAQLAANGLERGIAVSRSAGSVSQSNQLLIGGGFDTWGAWNETTWGFQLITQAKIIGGGILWCY